MQRVVNRYWMSTALLFIASALLVPRCWNGTVLTLYCWCINSPLALHLHYVSLALEVYWALHWHCNDNTFLVHEHDISKCISSTLVANWHLIGSELAMHGLYIGSSLALHCTALMLQWHHISSAFALHWQCIVTGNSFILLFQNLFFWQHRT